MMSTHVEGKKYTLTQVEYEKSTGLSTSGKRRREQGLMNHDTPESRRGATTEALVRKLLLTCLDGVVDVRISAPGTYLDDELKVDLVIDTTLGTKWGFQVKSSPSGAATHMSKDLPVPVMWIQPGVTTQRLPFLEDVVQFMECSVLLKSVVYEARELRAKLLAKGIHTVPKKMLSTVRLTPDKVNLLLLLGLAVQHQDTIILGSKP